MIIHVPTTTTLTKPASEVATVPARLAQLCRLANDVLRRQRAPEKELVVALEREEREVVESLERLDRLVEHQGSSRDEQRARKTLLGYLEVILRFQGAV